MAGIPGERKLGSSSIIIHLSAIRKLAAEAADNGLLALERAARIARVKSAKTVGVRTGNWLSLKQSAPFTKHPTPSLLVPVRASAKPVSL